jgi:hypothetical protein
LAALRISFQSFSFCCAAADAASNKKITTILNMIDLHESSVAVAAYSGWARSFAAIMVFPAEAELARDALYNRSRFEIFNSMQGISVAFRQGNRAKSHRIPTETVIGSGTVHRVLKQSARELSHRIASLLVPAKKVDEQNAVSSGAEGCNETRAQKRSA